MKKRITKEEAIRRTGQALRAISEGAKASATFPKMKIRGAHATEVIKALVASGHLAKDPRMPQQYHAIAPYVWVGAKPTPELVHKLAPTAFPTTFADPKPMGRPKKVEVETINPTPANESVQIVALCPEDRALLQKLVNIWEAAK